MVIKLAAQVAVTPAGKPVATPMPVAPVVAWVIAVKAVLINIAGIDEAALTVLTGAMVIVPVATTVPDPPVKGIV